MISIFISVLAASILHLERCSAVVSLPQPLVVNSTKYWDGLDGPWSTFSIGVGEPLQSFRGVPGLNSGMTLLPIACQVTANTSIGLVQACLDRTPFRYRSSTSWRVAGLYTVPLAYFDPSNLTSSVWGVDAFQIGTDSAQGQRLADIYVAGISEPDFFVPVFGLTHGEVGSSGGTKKTILSSMNDISKIPSESFGYTAGSIGKSKPGSLILGGYDASQFDEATALSVKMPSRENGTMVVSVIAVSITGFSGNTWSPSIFVIDSTLPQIWASADLCKMFEEAFRLEWNKDLAFYTLSSTTHSELVKESASVIFTISSGLHDDKVVNYTLPYSAFDLKLAPPLVNETTYYFPLKRSSNGINILGRAFLQEIYVIVDYERANFSISQARSGAPEDIVTIWNTTMAENDAIQAKKSAKDFPALYVGVVLAVSLIAILVIVLIIAWKRGWWLFRKTSNVVLEQERFDKAEMHGEARPRVEAMATERVELEVIERRLELIGSKVVHELHIEAR